VRKWVGATTDGAEVRLASNLTSHFLPKLLGADLYKFKYMAKF
jgi:hypothetical protein